jgi:hypothetical protein
MSSSKDDSGLPKFNWAKLSGPARRLMRLATRTRLGRLVLLGIWFVLCVALGAWYGTISSPRYNTEDAVITYLVNNFRIDADEPMGSTVLHMDVGLVRYHYSLKTNTVTKEVPDPAALIGKSPPRTWDEEESSSVAKLLAELAPPALAAAGAESVIGSALSKAGNLLDKAEPYSRPLTARNQLIFYVAAATVGISGGYLGYKITYDDRDLDGALVTKLLADPDMWRSSANLVAYCSVAKVLADETRLHERLNAGKPPGAKLQMSPGTADMVNWERQCERFTSSRYNKVYREPH